MTSEPLRGLSNRLFKQMIQQIASFVAKRALLLLSTLLCVQMMPWVMLWLLPPLPVPHFLIERLNASMKDYGLHLASQAPLIDLLRGRIYFKSPRLSFDKHIEETLGTCDQLSIHLDVLPLLRGDVTIKAAAIVNGSFYCPAIHSPSGIQERILSDLFVAIQLKDDFWRLEGLRFRMKALRLMSSGQGHFPYGKPERAFFSSRPKPDLSESGLTLLKKGVVLNRFIEQFKDPIVHLKLGERFDSHIKAIVHASGFEMSSAQMRIGPLHLVATATRPWTVERRQPFDAIEAHAEWLAFKQGRICTENIRTRVALTETGQPQTVQLSAANLSVDDNVFYYPNGQVRVSAASVLSGTLASALSDSESIELHGWSDVKTKAAMLTVMGDFNPLQLQLPIEDSYLHLGRMLRWPSAPPHLEVTLQFNPDLELRKAHFLLQAEKVEGAAARLYHLHGQGHIDRDSLALEFFAQPSASERLKGYFYRHHGSGLYRLKAEGALLELLKFHHWIPLQWWAELRRAFHFKDTHAYGTVYSSAKWGEAEQSFFYGELELNPFRYKDIPFDAAHLKLQWAYPKFELSDLRIRRPEGELKADVLLALGGKEGALDSIDFSVDSTLDPLAVMKTLYLPEKLQAFLEQLTFTHPPRFTLKGRRYCAPDTSQADTLSLFVEAPSYLHYKPMSLDISQFYLEMRARGLYGESDSEEGKGVFTLKAKDLTTIHLFGPFSRILKKAMIPLGTLHLQEASGSFRRTKEGLHFPDLVIRGPFSKIMVKGDYEASDQNLDFIADLFLFPQLEPLLRPINKTLRFQLLGTLGNPDWRLRINPLNLF